MLVDPTDICATRAIDLHVDGVAYSELWRRWRAVKLVDFAGVGDMEEDPQAQRWLHKAVAAPGHQHHEHR